MNQELTVIAARVLTEAVEADPAAIRAMLCIRIPCNKEFADHPTIICDTVDTLKGEQFDVGPIGVINGILTAMGAGRVASVWSDGDENEMGHARKLLGFEPYIGDLQVVAE